MSRAKPDAVVPRSRVGAGPDAQSTARCEDGRVRETRPAERIDERRTQSAGSPSPVGDTAASVDLYWLPLGAGGHSVRYNGRVFEWVAARLAHRPACDLYHAALVVGVPEGRYAIEQAPVPRGDPTRRGVVAVGAVGTRWAGRLRTFRYEIRRWRGGVIPDIAEAVASPRRLSADVEYARRVLDTVARVPTPVWGRDDLHAGEMWNSNSVMAWVITRAGLDIDSIQPPTGGRAPGWHAGVTVARRSQAGTHLHHRDLSPGICILSEGFGGFRTTVPDVDRRGTQQQHVGERCVRGAGRP